MHFRLKMNMTFECCYRTLYVIDTSKASFHLSKVHGELGVCPLLKLIDTKGEGKFYRQKYGR